MTDTETADESHEFDWLDDGDDVVVRSQPAIAIYAGPAGVVIRRQGELYGDGDDVVWFSVEQAPVIAAAIMAAAGLDATALTPEPIPAGSKPKDGTGAERQKRYRERKREGVTAGKVTREGVERDGRYGRNGSVVRDGDAA